MTGDLNKKMDQKYIEMANRLMVALDYPSVDEARILVEQLEGIPCYMKVGMQLLYAAGPNFILELKQKGYSVFLDVKMHDIPNTVKGGAHSLTKLGVDMFNVHAGGGIKMMAAAKEGAELALQEDPSLVMPIIIAVTQLTSTNQHTLNHEIGIPGTVEDSVIQYASHTKQAGLAGVVASPLEVQAIQQTCGVDFVTVTPGIRPSGSEIGDQSRILTPKQAIQQGSSFLVVGRPITLAEDPRLATEEIIKEMMSA